MTNNELPVFDFIGYHLISAKIVRKQFAEPSEIVIVAENLVHNGKEFSFDVKVANENKNDVDFSFRYHSSFRIIDKKWEKSLGGDEVLVSLLFPVVFPFIRQSIFAFTNDNALPLFIPIIDLRGANLIEGLKLVRVPNEKTTK